MGPVGDFLDPTNVPLWEIPMAKPYIVGIYG